MTEDQESTGPRWLDPDERAAWLATVEIFNRLPTALDAQMQRDAEMTFFEYMVLAMLSEQDDRTLVMTELAALSSASLSRLSHVCSRLENQGLVRRERVPGRGRRTAAVLTEAGWERVVNAAPAHVAAVRDLYIDLLDTEDRAALQRVGTKLADRLGRSGSVVDRP